MKKNLNVDIAAQGVDFITVRNVSTPEQKKQGTQIYIALLPAHSIIGLNTSKNVRDYLGISKTGKEKPNEVHKQIHNTLENFPENFVFLNNGISMCATDIDIDEKNKKLLLSNASIVNGAQTKGVVEKFYKEYVGDEKSHEAIILVKLLVTDDENIITDYSISSNTQNAVKRISIWGRQHMLDDLESLFKEKNSLYSLKTSESDTENGVEEGYFVDPEKLLSIIFTLAPESLISSDKYKFYTGKATSNNLFESIYKDKNEEDNAEELYKYILDIAVEAHELYIDLVYNQMYYTSQYSKLMNKGIKVYKSGKRKGEMIYAYDGFIYPLLASYSTVTVMDSHNKWKIDKNKLPFKQILRTTTSLFLDEEMGNSGNPNRYGKTKYAYTQAIDAAINFMN